MAKSSEMDHRPNMKSASVAPYDLLVGDGRDWCIWRLYPDAKKLPKGVRLENRRLATLLLEGMMSQPNFASGDLDRTDYQLLTISISILRSSLLPSEINVPIEYYHRVKIRGNPDLTWFFLSNVLFFQPYSIEFLRESLELQLRDKVNRRMREGYLIE